MVRTNKVSPFNREAMANSHTAPAAVLTVATPLFFWEGTAKNDRYFKSEDLP